ncbi:MAG TPA: diguanylate cyclase [Rhodanobacter sp.]|nr:diguanylate cyclase [Rhodanobacter sp.]
MSELRRRIYRLHTGLIGLLLLFFLCGSASAAGGDPWAPFDAPWFDQVGIAEGLPHSVTTALVQDRQGLIWIGTQGGVTRYDGYRTQVFGAGIGTAAGLPDAYVRSLLALPDGGVLIGTDAGGLARFDPASNAFRTYPIGANGTSDGKIYTLATDHAGGVWIATERGLDHLDLRTDTISHLRLGPGISSRNFSVLQDRAGNLWLGNNNGLFVRHTGSTGFVRPAHADGAPRNAGVATVLSNQVWAIHEDHSGRLWVGSGQAGAAYRDIDGQWQTVPGFSGYQGTARQPTVRDFLETVAGTIWIGTDGSGVIEYTPGSDHVRMIDHDAAVPSSLPGSGVRALLQDRSENIWVATDFGAARTNTRARTAFSMLPSPLNPLALANSNVHGIYVDSRSRIWLGLSSGLIDVIDLKAGSMQHLHLGGSQAHRDVHSFTETADGSIWVATQGLARIDPDTLAIQSSVLPALDNTTVLNLQSDASQLLLGTYEGAYRYDTHTHKLDHLTHLANDPHSLASNTVRQITRVGSNWWYSTTAGISIASDTSGDSFDQLTHRSGDPTSLPQDFVSSVTLDPKGRLWVSTFGGLGKIDPYVPGGPYRFHNIGIQQGLASDKLNAVLADGSGNVWLSMSNGVAAVDGDTLAVRNLGTRDGLRISGYISIAAAHAPGGELLFGGLGGLTVIRPQEQPPKNRNAPLMITQAVLDGVSLPFGQLPHDGDTLTLNRHGRSLRAGFALLDYQAPMETSYSYRMEGFDDDWIELPKGSLPTAIYTNLPYGDYTLRLRAKTHGMYPRSIETSLHVSVSPFWYETILANILGILLLLVAIFGLVHLRTLYLRQQARNLQRQIDDRTRDLQAANQRLDQLAGTDELTGIYNRRRFLELVQDRRKLATHHAGCMALLDLDHFKLVNDTYGHLAGDAVIRAATAVIQQHCRSGDLVGRYGGEELLLCLPDTDLQHAMVVSERIREALAHTSVEHDGQSISVTVSIGVAAMCPDESIEQWLSRADKALYEAKRAGRNRCVIAS